jgi:hypothetical protein
MRYRSVVLMLRDRLFARIGSPAEHMSTLMLVMRGVPEWW